MNNRGKDFFREKTEHQINRGGEDLTNRGQTLGGIMIEQGKKQREKLKTEQKPNLISYNNGANAIRGEPLTE